MMQPALHEEVAVTVRNTFLHYSVQDQGSSEGDGAEQPGLSRATTAPVTSPSEGREEMPTEVEPAGRRREEESNELSPSPFDLLAAESSPDAIILLGRLSQGGVGRSTEKPAGRRMAEENVEFGKQPALQRIVTHDLDDCRPCESDAALSTRCAGVKTNQLVLQQISTHDPFDCTSCDLDVALQADALACAPFQSVPACSSRDTEQVATTAKRFPLRSTSDDLVKDKATCDADFKGFAVGAPTLVIKADARGRHRHDRRGGQPRTTVMLRNLPNNYTRAMLLDLIDSEGFAGKYDFLYLPIDFRTHAALGYAFINLVTPEDAVEFYNHLSGFSRWSLPSSKVCSAGWSHPHQGLEDHIARYRNSPLMHEAVPDSYRPILFSSGMRVDFPEPTKKIKPPRQGTQRMLV
mmetsp:Transcript_111527/g.279290  ORF Transcript_111527/g.279290 Transcript_111527/m.279290 type:complete len:407 (+) Transcript_111527:64-1284(+)